MRERTTWNRDEITKRAAMPKQADPYLMNQDHVKQQPTAEKYMNGDPSSWAEDVHSPNEWEKEYADGKTKRNEIGEPEMRPETFNHAEKTAADQALLVKKADLCVKVARKMLGKKASEGLVEDQAVALMSLTDADLIDTFNRLANDDQGQQDQGGDDQMQQQAGEQQQEQQAQAGQQQEQQAGMQQQSAYQQAAQQCMEAAQQGDQQKMQAAMQQMVQALMQQQGGQQGQQQAPAMGVQAKAKKAQDDQGQQAQGGQDMQQQATQQEQQAVQQQQAAGQDMMAMIQQAAQQAVQQALAGQQAPAEQAPAMQAQAGDDALLDDMLMGPGAAMEPAVGDIELEPSPMDVGEVGFGPEDDALKMLFANDGEEQEQAPAQAQDKQAAVRTASTRTVGTKPTGGVSRVGGLGAPATKTAAAQDVDKLSSLWSSAPDVREHFGIK